MPSFWSDVTLEPKRAYRFRCLLADNDAYTIKTVKNPTVKISETPHKFLNHTFYYPGRAEWDPVDVTFVDPANPDQTLRLYNKLISMGYASPTDSEAALSGFTKSAATVAIGDVRIQALGPAGGATDTTLDVIGQWFLKNAFFTNISWGDFSYDSEDMIELSTTIRYDYAEYSGADATLKSFAG
jgi:hypothetical protein